MTEAQIEPEGAKLVDSWAGLDNRFRITLYQEPSTDRSRRVRAIHTMPVASADWKDCSSEVQTCFESKGIQPNSREQSFLDAVGPVWDGDLFAFAKIAAGNAVANTMGYRVSITEKEDVSKDQKLRSTELEYPTVDALNEFVTGVFGDGKSLRYATFLGSYFKAVDFMPRFIEKGEFLVANQQTGELHEHTNTHVIGALGIGGDFLKFIQDSMGRYLAEGNEDIIKTGFKNIDRFTASLGKTFLEHGSNTDKAFEEFVEAIKTFYEFRPFGGKVVEYPFGEPTDDEIVTIANGMTSRFRKVEEYAQETESA